MKNGFFKVSDIFKKIINLTMSLRPKNHSYWALKRSKISKMIYINDRHIRHYYRNNFFSSSSALSCNLSEVLIDKCLKTVNLTILYSASTHRTVSSSDSALKNFTTYYIKSGVM